MWARALFLSLTDRKSRLQTTYNLRCVLPDDNLTNDLGQDVEKMNDDSADLVPEEIQNSDE